MVDENAEAYEDKFQASMTRPSGTSQMNSAFERSKDFIVPKKHETENFGSNHMVKLLMASSSPSVMKPVGEECDEEIMDF